MRPEIVFHPNWLERSAIPVTIVCGPPCSGKTTYVQRHASSGDIVIDLDSIMSEIDPSYSHWAKYESDSSLLAKAVEIRNNRLSELASQTAGKAWVIVSAPTSGEREWWKRKLGGKIVLLHPGVQECRRRAEARGTPYARHGVERWETKSRQPWRPRSCSAPTPIGIDGWPIG